MPDSLDFCICIMYMHHMHICLVIEWIVWIMVMNISILFRRVHRKRTQSPNVTPTKQLNNMPVDDHVEYWARTRRIHRFIWLLHFTEDVSIKLLESLLKCKLVYWIWILLFLWISSNYWRFCPYYIDSLFYKQIHHLAFWKIKELQKIGVSKMYLMQ